MPMNRKAPTIKQLVAAVAVMDPRLPRETEEFEAALVLMAALRLGSQNLAALSRLTELPYAQVYRLAQRLKSHGIWTSDRRTVCNWFDGPRGIVQFWCDVNLALGHFGFTERRQG